MNNCFVKFIHSKLAHAYPIMFQCVLGLLKTADNHA